MPDRQVNVLPQNDSLKIVLVTHYLLPHQGGIEFVTDQLAKYLKADNHQVTMVASSIGSINGVETNGNLRRIGVPAVDLFARFGIPFPLFNPFRLFFSLKLALKDADVVHAHGVLYLSCIAAVISAKRRGIRVIITEHVGFVDYNNKLFNFAEKIAFHLLGRLCCHFGDVIVVLNTRISSELRSLISRRLSVVKVMNGVDTNQFYPAPDSRESLRKKWGFENPTILFVGRLVPKKGLHLLTEIAGQDFDLIVCGRGEMTSSNPRVRYLGSLPQNDLVELYQASDLFCLPSEGEGFPLVVQEALACGLPVVLLDNTVNREYLDETVACFTEKDSQSLLKTIKALLNDPIKLDSMKVSARRWAVQHFDWEITTEQYLRLYRNEVEIK